MDLSINKIKNIKQNKINFSGMKGAYNAQNIPVFKFVLPPYDKDKEKVTLELAILSKDKNDRYLSPSVDDLQEIEAEEGKDCIDIEQEDVKYFSDGFAYRFRIDPIDKREGETRYFVDDFKTIDLLDSTGNTEGKLNLIEQGVNYAITPKIGPMRHSFLDSDAILIKDKDKESILKPQDKSFVRNHFNKLGGSTKGLTYLLKHSNVLDPYTYIMSTPDIGADKVSSHKYWPSNQYQCSNIDDFKEFNYELFKRGKGYIADGAFTSQGIQSPLVQHVLKWGKNSPFYNMLKVEGKIQLGILPDKLKAGKDTLENIGIRLVNRPNTPDYDDKRPTYLQFFDKRLLSPEKRDDTKNLCFSYDQEPKDHYDIVTHNDSVQPYYFEVDPSDKKIKEAFRYNNVISLSSTEKIKDFLVFDNFEIVDKSHAGGANFWDGNVDIIKMNLSNPGLDEGKIQGCIDARNYLLNVASFWSETVQSDLILNTAKESPRRKEEIAKNNRITPQEYEEIKDNLDDIHSLVLEQNKSIEQYIKEFPLQSIETAPELSAIFAQPGFNDELFSSGTLDRFNKIVNKYIEDAIPKQYKDNGEYKTYVVKTYAPRIIKNILAGAMCPQALNDKNGDIDYKKLSNTYIKSLTSFACMSPEKEKTKVIDLIKKEIKEDSAVGIFKEMKEDLENISLEDFKLAEAIVEKGRGGLNWRFDASKDIADLDSVRSGDATFERIWQDAQSFWREYIENVRKYNPASYIIAEITDLWSFLGNWSDEELYNFDSKLAKDYFNHDRYNRLHEKELPYTKEMDFLEQINATTGSNYDAYFNNLSMFAGVNPENGSDDAISQAGNLKVLKDKTQNFMQYAQPNTAMLSHVFFENHDKPRLLHTLPLDMNLFLMQNFNAADDETKKFAEKITGRVDYKNMSPRAIAVAQIFSKAIEDLYSNDETKKEALYKSLRKLTNGSRPEGDGNDRDYKRANAFGNMPYEISVYDLFRNAGDYNEAEITEFCYKILSNSMGIQERLWQVLCAIGGVNALYNGMEYAQTGYEESCKNPDVTNRNQILHQRATDKNSPFVDYYKKVSAITSLYKQKDLNALKDGFKISLEIPAKATNPKGNEGAYNYVEGLVKKAIGKNNTTVDKFFETIEKNKAKGAQKYEKCLGDIGINGDNIKAFEDNIDTLKENLKLSESPLYFWPIYSYDEQGSKVISIITKNGLPKGQSFKENDLRPKKTQVEEIEIKDKKGNCPLKDGTRLRRKVYSEECKKYVDDNIRYFVEDGAIKSEAGNIILGDTVETFYVPSR